MTTALPRVVSAEEWQAARESLLAKEKELMKAQDHLTAERRRLPMVRFAKPYEFDSAEGKKSLLDLFEGRSQLIVYHFMLHPGDEAGCPGCSMVIDNVPHLAHLNARDVTFTVTAPATLPEIEAYKARMGWDVPWVSAHGSDFTEDCGVGRFFGVSVFLRDGDDVYRTYFTSGRGAETFLASHRYLDITPFGRQEAWEEESRGTDEPGSWWRRHDEY
ncbi:DUF899 domain-containing protein [Amycolatopsis sp. FDAARGOS 1241]|uniref:DUF899 domain-containing protein n=1 Tax=Amycolatopsis sp. FDAARGOS 1241 TaxID=2778070 RepID=UPI00194FCC51|nr:DUF899 domain-containing protein [Amycolatopsis sp. FDAARGOS 1241]QRP44013.1 DUF899 domain-containing protein [Amycolatopsis sp. FDAARGOS 1241]